MLPERRTVGALLAHLAQAMPQQEAVVLPPRRLTYAALYAQATAVACGLWRLGIRPGEPVALLLSNRPEWIMVALGCALIGVPVVAISTWSRRVELEYVLDHSQAVALVTLDRFLGADYQALLTEIVPEVAQHLPGQLGATRLPALRELIVLGQPALAAARGFDEVLALGRNLDAAVVCTASTRVQPTDVLYVLYTSGSTARPKGVTLTHAGCLENGFNIGERQHLTRADRLWLAVPLFWSFAAANALMALITHGGTVVLQERFDPEEAVRLIATERCTVYYGMSHMAQAMLETPAWGRAAPRSLRTGLTIGTPEEMALTMYGLGVREICNVYGATETYGNATVTDAHEPETLRLHSQGKPLPGMQLRIVHQETRAILPPGEVGEILVAGYVTPGYYRDPENNAQAFDAEGYFLTGDLGLLDAEGRLHFRGRLKDLIKSGGINISPLEVETYLMTYPKVQYAAVVGLPNTTKGEVAELAAVWDRLEHSPVRCIILTGAGERAFSAGADMRGDLSADPEMARIVNHALLKHHPLSKPIIAAVNGDCVAGGLELLLSTDIRATVSHARFGLPEVHWSIYPFGGATVKLIQQIGYVHAMELLLTATLIDATAAAQIGLVNRVVPTEELMPWALATAATIAANSPTAVQAVKQQISTTMAEQALAREALDQALGDRVRASPHFTEGVTAFRHKRQPHYP